MINHARTLLLNMRAPSPLETADGDEYIDPAFSSVLLSGGLSDLCSILVPSAGARVDRNFRVNTLMVLLHAPDFEKYVLSLDSRITYSSASFAYASEASPRGDWPSFNMARVYDGLVASMGRTGYQLFEPGGFMVDDMAELKDVWYGNLALKDRLTAAVAAAVYKIDRNRAYGV